MELSFLVAIPKGKRCALSRENRFTLFLELL